MDGAGANMCKAVNIDGVAVKATFVSRVCVGGMELIIVLFNFQQLCLRVGLDLVLSNTKNSMPMRRKEMKQF